MAPIDDRLLILLTDDRRQPIEPANIDLVEADEGNTRGRTRHAETLVDRRQLYQLLARTCHLSARPL
jgi:hypothetical protein